MVALSSSPFESLLPPPPNPIAARPSERMVLIRSGIEKPKNEESALSLVGVSRGVKGDPLAALGIFVARGMWPLPLPEAGGVPAPMKRATIAKAPQTSAAVTTRRDNGEACLAAQKLL